MFRSGLVGWVVAAGKDEFLALMVGDRRGGVKRSCVPSGPKTTIYIESTVQDRVVLCLEMFHLIHRKGKGCFRGLQGPA